MANKEEYIVCAAIHYRDGIVYKEQPVNIESGFVVTGYRHGNCVAVLEAFYPNYNEDMAGRDAQGFLTSKNRYVDRSEGYEIALKQNQLLIGPSEMKMLTSEDLYWPNEQTVD